MYLTCVSALPGLVMYNKMAPTPRRIRHIPSFSKDSMIMKNKCNRLI